MKIRSGLSIIEMTIVLGISFSILAMIGSNLSEFFRSSLVEGEAEELSSLIRLAKSYSSSGLDNSRFMIVLGPQSYSLQREDGTLIESKQVDSRLLIGYSTNIILFEQIIGTSDSCSPTCTISISYGNTSENITVTNQGIVNVE
jgi:hypothetical protein